MPKFPKPTNFFPEKQSREVVLGTIFVSSGERSNAKERIFSSKALQNSKALTKKNFVSECSKAPFCNSEIAKPR